MVNVATATHADLASAVNGVQQAAKIYADKIGGRPTEMAALNAYAATCWGAQSRQESLYGLEGARNVCAVIKGIAEAKAAGDPDRKWAILDACKRSWAYGAEVARGKEVAA